MAARGALPGALVRVALASVLAASGCDVVLARPSSGPRIVSTTPADGATDVDRRAQIRIEFDRRLAPSSVAVDSARLYSGGRSVGLATTIDVIRPALVLRPRSTLDPEATYVLEVDALRDLDGNLGAEPDPSEFHAGTAREGVPAPDEIPFERVGPIFEARCATSRCHAGAAPVLGLDLSRAESIRRTAIGVPASEVRRPVAGAAASSAPALTGLAIIDVSAAARSYLVYKILGDPHVRGSPMPPPVGEGGEGALTAAEVELVVAWIAGGAPLPGPP